MPKPTAALVALVLLGSALAPLPAQAAPFTLFGNKKGSKPPAPSASSEPALPARTAPDVSAYIVPFDCSKLASSTDAKGTATYECPGFFELRNRLNNKKLLHPDCRLTPASSQKLGSAHTFVEGADYMCPKAPPAVPEWRPDTNVLHLVGDSEAGPTDRGAYDVYVLPSLKELRKRLNSAVLPQGCTLKHDNFIAQSVGKLNGFKYSCSLRKPTRPAPPPPSIAPEKANSTGGGNNDRRSIASIRAALPPPPPPPMPGQPPVPQSNPAGDSSERLSTDSVRAIPPPPPPPPMPGAKTAAQIGNQGGVPKRMPVAVTVVSASNGGADRMMAELKGELARRRGSADSTAAAPQAQTQEAPTKSDMPKPQPLRRELIDAISSSRATGPAVHVATGVTTDAPKTNDLNGASGATNIASPQLPPPPPPLPHFNAATRSGSLPPPPPMPQLLHGDGGGASITNHNSRPAVAAGDTIAPAEPSVGNESSRLSSHAALKNAEAAQAPGSFLDDLQRNKLFAARRAAEAASAA